MLAAVRMQGYCRARLGEDSEARKNSIMPGFAPKKKVGAWPIEGAGSAGADAAS
jgi:hypothetical protein